MKLPVAILLLLIAGHSVFANEIDGLSTIKQVEDFLHAKVNPNWGNKSFFDTSYTDTAAFGKNKFFKIDLDKNGLTDIIINGTYLFAITDNGNDSYGIHFIDKGAFLDERYTLANIISTSNNTLLVVTPYKGSRYTGNRNRTFDTLIYKFDGLTEYNPLPDNYSIREIKLTTTACYGTCPVFELTIESGRTAIYNAVEYNEENGKFRGTIDAIVFNTLINTINYIKLKKLKNEYAVDWTDDQTAILEIKYNNGQVKKIKDYGLIGTFGLRNVYDQIFALRKTQEWEQF